MKNSTTLTIKPGTTLRGRAGVPGDKSISHRTLLLGALADGTSHIEGFLPSGDCHATQQCMRALGIEVETPTPSSLIIHGRGLKGLRAPAEPLNCVRSGTTMRLLAGILAGQPFNSTLSGDEQLMHRPMRRIVRPLQQMDAQIRAHDGRAPLEINGHALRSHTHTLAVASAQVKSALLLAGLYADGPTTIQQPGPARDHSERMLSAMGADIQVNDLCVTLRPLTQRQLRPLTMSVPGDISSAAFPLMAALLLPGSALTLQNVGINPTRTGLLEVLRAMGAKFSLENERVQGGEPLADINVHPGKLSGTQIGGDTVVRMIDEFPILAVAATQAHGHTEVRDAAELRVKETDRIAVIATELQKLGANIEPRADGFVVVGPTPLHGGEVDSHGDHRIAMALVVAGLLASAPVKLHNAACIADSFPGFEELLRGLGAGLNSDAAGAAA